MNEKQIINHDWIKENWFKIGVLVAILIFSYAVYNGKNSVFKSGMRNDTDSLKLAMQCRTDGEKKFQEDKDTATSEKYKQEVVDCYYYDPAYLFNKELNTCLYSGGYTCDLQKKYSTGVFKDSNAKRWTRHITDVYTNKDIDSVYVDDSSNVNDWLMKDINDFWGKSEKLGF